MSPLSLSLSLSLSNTFDFIFADGHWRYLTTRDLLVSFNSCMHHLKKQCHFLTITRTSEDSVKVTFHQFNFLTITRTAEDSVKVTFHQFECF